MNDYLTPHDVAKILKLSERTVRRLVASGKLEGTRIGDSPHGRIRIEASAVERFMSGEK